MLANLLRKQVHSSWHIDIASSGVVFGVWLAALLPIGMFASMAWLFTGIGLVATGIWRANRILIVLSLVGGLCIGLWRGSISLDDDTAVGQYIGQQVRLTGAVTEDTEKNNHDQLIIRLTAMTINGREASGNIWVTTKSEALVRRSDVVTVNAVLADGFGSFSASAYLADIVRVTRSTPGDIALTVRDEFSKGVTEVISEPQASLGLGELVGQRRGLPEELDTALQAAGLTHIVVASGYNLTILVRLARRLFERISKYLSFISASGMILAFIAITGMSPSMSRAGLVAGLSLLAWYYGRRFHPLVLLPFAMAITLLVQPSYAWGDIGWQLSFAAFGGVMILAPLLHAYFFGDKTNEQLIRRILVETISAQICTLPILLVTFGQFSVIAPIANLLILPFVPLAMLLTFIGGIGGLVIGKAAHIIALPAELLLSYMTTTTQYLGNLPWAVQEISLTWLGATMLFGCIIATCVYMWHKTKFSLSEASLVE